MSEFQNKRRERAETMRLEYRVDQQAAKLERYKKAMKELEEHQDEH